MSGTSIVAEPLPNGTSLNGTGGGGTLRADLTKEYAAGGTWPSSALLRTLPLAIDDITADFGDDLYQRMMFDARVASEVDNLRAAILEDGLILSPAIEDEAADGYALSREIHAAAERMLEDLETPLDDVLWDMLSAVARGNRIAEEVYAYGDVAGRTGLTLTALHVKPRESVSFVVDPYNRVVGLLARIPGQAFGGTGQLVGFDPASPPANLLPRGKFAVLSFRPVNNDPRGTSVLRPAYFSWSLKVQAIREHVKYLARFASPALVGIMGPGARDQAVLDPVTHEPTGAVITAADAFLTKLLEFHNGSALAIPFNYQVKDLYSQGEGRAFLVAFAEYNRDITLAISGQTLASTEGEHNARAAAEVHQDTKNTRARQAKKAVATMIRRDILTPFVLYNWGEEAARLLTPRAALGSVEEEDVTPRWTAAASLNTSGYLTPSQKQALDPLIGLPQRTPEEVAREEEQASQPPPAPPGKPSGTQPGQADPDQEGAAA